MTVRVVTDWDDRNDPAVLAALNRPTHGVVWVPSRPATRRINWLVWDHLQNMGQAAVDTLNNAGGAYDHMLRLVALWHTHDVHHVIVSDLARLHTGVLTDMVILGVQAGATVWFVAAGAINDETRTWLDGWDPEPVDVTVMLDLLNTPDTRSTPVPPPSPDAEPPVPQAGFLTWRAAARRQLDPHLFTQTDHDYLAGWTAWHDHLARSNDPHDTAAAVIEWALNARTALALTARVRGMQAAAFLDGWAVEADLEELDQRRRLHPDQQPWHQLTSIGCDWRAAATVLFAAGLTAEQIANLTINDIASDGTPTNSNIPDGGRVTLRMWRLYRAYQGAAGTEPFLVNGKNLPVAPRDVTNGVRWVQRSTGIRTAVGRSLSLRTAASHWQLSRGWHLKEIQ